MLPISSKLNKRGIRTIIGIALVASQATWIIGIGLKRRRLWKAKARDEAVTPTTVAQVPELEPVVQAIQELATSALTFLELRQLNHWLNSEQWYFAHEQESKAVREARSQYTNSKTRLQRVKEKAPDPIVNLINEYCSFVEERIAEEDFSSPSDTSLRDGVIQSRQITLERLGGIWLSEYQSSESA